jgi:Big-like domain-containing protein
VATLRGRQLVVAAAVAVLAMPASASAAARFASPTGNGTACTEAAPCDVVTAVNNAQSGDDVTIEPGSYTVTTTLADNGLTLRIHGQAGAARPVITNSTTNGIQLEGPGSSVSDVEFDIASGGGDGIDARGQQTIDRVIVKLTNSADTVPACTVLGTMTDSVCWTVGTNGIAAFNGNNGVTASATLRNDTLMATGSGGIGVYVQGFGSGASPSIALVNSIVHGAGNDILATNINGTSATVTADHSNFATSTQSGAGASAPAPGSGTNQSAPPQFAGGSSGDFHELAASPTVDAGVDSALNGTLDADGLPRTMGAHADIGAFEHPLPICQPLSATTPFGKALTVRLDCADPSGAPISSYAIVTPPAHGTLSVSAGGTATYVPARGFSGPDSFSFEATSGNGTGGPAAATIMVASSTPPVLTGVAESHRRWREGKAVPHITRARRRRPPVGTAFLFTLNEPARVRFAFTQRLRGRRVGKRCDALTRKNRHHRACTRTVSRGALSFAAGAGAHRLLFDGRISKHKGLNPGRSKVTITATNATGQHSSPKTLSFTIVR